MSFPARAAVSVVLCLGVVLASASAAVAAIPAGRSEQTCHYRNSPAPPIDASEAPAPGQSSPAPLAVPATAAGGARLTECGVVVPDGVSMPPANQFESWLLADLDTGAVLAAQDPHARQRPASLIKILLALVVLRDLPIDAVVTGTQEDANQEGTRVGIGPDGHYRNDQLLAALLMGSGNDVAHAFANELGGMQATVDKMNALAHTLGAADTRTATPSGLDGPGMSSSAYDLAVLFRTGMRDPRFAKVVATKQLDLPGYGSKPGFVVANDNPLLYNYPGDLGGKTGYTDDAKHTYVNAAQRGNTRLVLVGMYGSMSPVTMMYTQSKSLLDYGFTLAQAKTAPVGQLIDDGPVTPTVASSPAQQVSTSVNSAPAESSSSTGWLIAGILVVLATVITIGLRRQRYR